MSNANDMRLHLALQIVMDIAHPVLVLDMEGNIVGFNATMRELIPEVEQGHAIDAYLIVDDVVAFMLNPKTQFIRLHQTPTNVRVVVKPLVDTDCFLCSIDPVTQATNRNSVPDVYRLMIQQMQQGVFVYDNQHTIRYVNRALCRMLGYRPHDLVGESIFKIFPEDDHDEVRQRIYERERGKSHTYETRLRQKNGEPLYIIAAASPYRDEDHGYAGAFAVCTDISERKATEEALIRSNAELDAFAHTVAHDLKNPLSVLMGFADLLESEFTSMPPNEVQYYLQTVGRTADKMINIIDELLLLAQMRHAEVTLMPCDLRQTFEECLQRTRYMTLQYGAEINIIDGDNLPEVLSYAPWIEAALVNYISNGIKYGGNPPHVQIGAQILPDGRTQIWVRDNGAGVPAEKIDRLFVEFDRLEEVRKKGYGIGLSIVKRIMDKLDGEVLVESELGQGSTFSLILPTPKATSAAQFPATQTH